MNKEQTKQVLTLGFQAAVICTVISFLVGLVLNTTDLGAFVMGTILYGVAVGGMSWPANHLLHPSPPRQRWVFIGLLAVVSSYLWTLLFFGVLGGGIFPLFTLQIAFLYYWMIGGAAAFLYSTSYNLGNTRPISTRQSVALLLFLPLILVGGAVLLGSTVATLANTSEPERYLIPAGYEGPVMVVYNQPEGSLLQHSGSTRIYEIPPDGLLLTQSAPIGSSKPEFWYVDEQGQTIETIVWGRNCVEEFPGDPVIACIKGQLTFAESRTLPLHTLFIVGPLSQQTSLAEGVFEWQEEHLVRLADQ